MEKDLEPQELLRVIFDYAANIANERKVERLLMLMAGMGREMVVSDRCTVWLLDRHKNELYATHEIEETKKEIIYPILDEYTHDHRLSAAPKLPSSHFINGVHRCPSASRKMERYRLSARTSEQ